MFADPANQLSGQDDVRNAFLFLSPSSG